MKRTPAQLAALTYFMSTQLVIEANHTRNPLTERRLRSRARQLLYAYPNAYSTEPGQYKATWLLLEDAIDELVVAIVTRTEQQLETGATP